MQLVTIQVEDRQYRLLLAFLQTLSYVEVVQPQAPKPSYDFSDLGGKLAWQGDAVQEQRRLRDEW